jgi:hypothetical protein
VCAGPLRGTTERNIKEGGSVFLSLAAPIAALGLGWIGTIIVVILLIVLLTRVL